MPPRLTRSRLSNGGSPLKSNGVTRRKSQRANKVTNKPIEIVVDDSSDTDSDESNNTPLSSGLAVLSNGVKHNHNKRQREIEDEDEEQAQEIVQNGDNGAGESTDEESSGEEEESESEEQEHYEVENIVGKQFDRDGSTFYLVKWKNWDGEPTWEPEANCLSCYNLVKKFEDSLAECQKNKVSQLDDLLKGIFGKGSKNQDRKQNRKQKRKSPTGSVAKKKPVKLEFARIKRNRRSNH